MTTPKEQLATQILSYLSPQGLRGMKLMTSAGPFALEKDGLSFRFKGSPRANHVRITLNHLDLFDLTLGRIRNGNYQVVHEAKDIFCEDLGQAFRDETGLETRVPTIVQQAAHSP